MKRLLWLMFGLGIIPLLFCSCGTLNQQIGGSQLSKGNLAFARNMISEPDDFDMRLTYDGETRYTDKWASSVVPLGPILYWTTLGSFRADANDEDTKDSYFAVRKVDSIIPLFYLKHDSIYDRSGKRQASGLAFNLALAVGYESFSTAKSDAWRCGLVWIPGIGPFLGFGSDYFQFLWIPFSDLD